MDITKTASIIHFNTTEADNELLFQQLYSVFYICTLDFCNSTNLILKHNLLLGRMKIVWLLNLFQNFKCEILHKKANNFKLDIIFWGFLRFCKIANSFFIIIFIRPSSNTVILIEQCYWIRDVLLSVGIPSKFWNLPKLIKCKETYSVGTLVFS